MLDGDSKIIILPYFSLIVVFSGFFSIKIILAAQNEALFRLRRDEKKRKIYVFISLKKVNPELYQKIQAKRLMHKHLN